MLLICLLIICLSVYSFNFLIMVGFTTVFSEINTAPGTRYIN